MTTERTDYWQVIVLTPTGVVPGTYDHVSLNVGSDGRILSITAPTIFTDTIRVADQTALAGIVASSANGRLAVVTDNGNGYPALYVFNGTIFTQIGNDPRNSIRYVQQLLGFTTNQNIGAPVHSNAIIKKVGLRIITPYTAGTSIDIRDGANVVYMAIDQNDPLTVGTYFVESISQTQVGPTNSQLKAVVSGGPSVGQALVTVEYLLPT